MIANKIKHLLVFGLLMILFIATYIGLSSNDKSFDFRYDPLPQNIRSIKLNETYSFAGEKVPINIPDVSERLERELLLNTYQHSSTILHLKLSLRYFPEIEKILAENNVPNDFKYLAVAESSLRNAVSPAGAKGMWQFRDAAAKELDLEINDWVDERNHFEKSTIAACKYLNKLKNRFGTWTLAAAAYNMGPNALSDALTEQKETDYYNLNLSDETNRYIFRILGAKEILNHPDKFGFYIPESEAYSLMNKFKIVELSKTIPSLADFAHENSCSYRMLKVYNPWLTKSSLINKTNKTYYIKIPKE